MPDRTPVAVDSARRSDEPAPSNASTTTTTTTTTNDDDSVATSYPKIDYYYVRMNPNDVERTSLLDSHALFGALWGEGLIERYNVYRRANILKPEEEENAQAQRHQHQQQQQPREMAVVDIKLGERLNGHGGIVHGGIVSLLIDEAMGWAWECLRLEEEQQRDGKSDDYDSSTTTAVTANLTVDFRAPFHEGSDAVIRVYHGHTIGRKIFFSARLESKDGSVVYAEANSLFVRVRSDRLTSR